jgi:MFS family permease
MHILIWLVNSNIENSFSTAIIGLMYGPVWPASLTMLSEILPPDVRMMGMAILYVELLVILLGKTNLWSQWRSRKPRHM